MVPGVWTTCCFPGSCGGGGGMSQVQAKRKCHSKKRVQKTVALVVSTRRRVLPLHVFVCDANSSSHVGPTGQQLATLAYCP